MIERQRLSIRTLVENRPQRIVLAAGLTLAAVALTLLVRKIVQQPEWPGGTDISVYLTAASGVLSRTTPYRFDVPFQDPYPYPPFFAEVIAALTFVLGFGKGWIAWSLAGAAALVASIVLMTRRLDVRLPVDLVALVTGVMLASHLVRSDVYHGQVNFLILLCIVAGLKAWLGGSRTLACVLWSVAIVTKPFLGLLVFFLARKGDFRSALATLVGSGLLFGLSFLLGFDHPIAVFQDWSAASHWHTSLPNVAKPDNQTFYGFFMRLFSETPFGVPLATSALAPRLFMLPVVAAAIVLFLTGVSRDPRPVRGSEVLLELGVTLAVFMACGPLMEGDHIFLLLPGLFGAVLMAIGPGGGPAWTAAVALWTLAFANVFIPVALNQFVPHQWPPLEGVQHLRGVHHGALFFAAAAFSALVLMRERRGSARPAGYAVQRA